MRIILFLALAGALAAQTHTTEAGDDIRGYNDTPQLPGQPWKVHDMARPRAPKVTPGPAISIAPPSDAIVLFDGTSLSHWIQMDRKNQPREPRWRIENGNLALTPNSGRMITKEKFGDCQLHVEWMIPEAVTGSGQGRGNSGVELMMRYEVQVLESHTNLTYADGAAGALYGVWPPLVNPARPQGQWNAYDIVFEAPRFDGDKLIKPAYMTVFFNGILVQNHKEEIGTTIWRQVAKYTPHAPEEPLGLQDHGQSVLYRNIWIRRL